MLLTLFSCKIKVQQTALMYKALHTVQRATFVYPSGTSVSRWFLTGMHTQEHWLNMGTFSEVMSLFLD